MRSIFRTGVLCERIGICSLMLLLVFPCAVRAQPKSGLRIPPPVNVAEARERGTAIVADLLSRQPEPSSRTNTIKTRDRSGVEKSFPVHFEFVVTPTNWVGTYEAGPATGGPHPKLRVVGNARGERGYYLSSPGAPGGAGERQLKGNETMVPFAGTEFWVADLGLEFYTWPQQLLLSNDVRKGQSCHVLQSINPTPAPSAYSQVVTWVDIDTGGIVHADAYDSDRKVLKQFDPSELQKVEGHMQVKEVEMRNRKTGGRSWLVFDLQ